MRIASFFILTAVGPVLAAWAENHDKHISTVPFIPISKAFTNSRFQKRAPGSKTATSDPAELLESFVASLRSFIYDTGFNVIDFESSAAQLEEELHEIEVLVEHSGRRKRDLSAQVQYSKVMFEAMADAIEPLKLYKVTGVPEHSYLNLIIKLNINLLALHESRGIPDPKIDQYNVKVESFSHSVKHWNDKFKGMEVAYGVRRLFRIQYTRAQSTLDNLVGYVPKQSKADGLAQSARNAFSRLKTQLSLP